jgi:hypothetical protein
MRLGVRTSVLVSFVLVCACLPALVAQAPASAQSQGEPQHVPWTELLPPLPAGYEPTTENLCVQGQLRCVDVVIREMQRRFKPLASRCDHDAVFALIYLRTTEAYRRAAATPGFFSDPAFVNHQDVVFAAYYFQAYDAYHRGRGGAVPEAWRIAFDAADRRAVSGVGNLLLGMSAHVNRDLPFALEAIGIAKPDGSSRKPDHDQVNQFLVGVTDDVIPEAARRFDPTMDDGSVEGTTLDETGTFQLLAAWREEAWRNAERLASAPTAQARAAVERDIEDGAALKARLLLLQSSYVAPLSSSAPRDAWCATHGNDR